MAAVLALLLGIAAAGVRYYDFVFRTVYEESTAHLPEMLVFACPENQGTYRGFAYDAVAVSYYNNDIVKVLDISAFDGTASRYVIHPDGRIVINCAAQEEENVYNLLAAMQERSPLTGEDIQTLSE